MKRLKKIFPFIISVFFLTPAYSQSEDSLQVAVAGLQLVNGIQSGARPLPPEDYWQQRVDYDIEVALDDVKHELTGSIKIEYTNNSPDTLGFIWFHLWPNAYKNLNTAFAKQQLENRNTEFYFSKPEERGYIDLLDFLADGLKLEWKYDSTHIDICKVVLPQPLTSGKTITISTPFRVKIPASFSRLGHAGQSYQITQWYPKPAVYDKNGWHPMPYLDQGEFYSEFGSFDVRITVPKNYVVAASGNLQNEEELKWLNELAERTSKLAESEDTCLREANRRTIGNITAISTALDLNCPASEPISKTLHYQLDNAHDFAWFADKKFWVLKNSMELPSANRNITTWSFFTSSKAQLWKRSSEYLRDAIYYYSKWLGNYPYENVTAVEAALSAGGGMEYPTITVIGKVKSDISLETVLIHEVGHNWFYGILGTNERDHPWLDEGINSFYENRYLKEKYPDKKWLHQLDTEGLRRFLDVDDYDLDYTNELGYLYTATRHLDQPIELPATAYSYINYGTIVYFKSALAFEHLKSYLGDSLFDSIMRQYYVQWKFQHPQPKDLRHVFESISKKNLSWFFHDIIKTDEKLDYKIANLKKDKTNNIHTLTIINRTGIASPFPLSAIRKDSVVKTIWVEGFERVKKIEIADDNYDLYRIDANRTTTEFNRKNNNYRLRGLMHKAERLRFQMFGSVHNPNKTQLFFTPVAGWNNYDKTLVGFAFYNHFLPFKKFEFELVPMFGTGSTEFAGIGSIGYTFYVKKSKVHNINLSLQGKRFSYLLFPETRSYNKIQPVLTFEFRRKNPRSPVDKYLSFRSVNVWQDTYLYDTTIDAYRTSTRYFVNEAAFRILNNRIINPIGISICVQQGKDFVRSFAELNYKFNYNSEKKGLFIRLFAGGFLWNDRDGFPPNASFQLNYSTGFMDKQKDFLFDEYFFGRNETEIFSSQQIVVKEGGFRSHSGIQTDKWLATVNLTSTIPGRIPIRPYTSIGVYGDEGSNVNLAYELGLSVVILPEIFEVYFPLVSLVQLTPPGQETRTLKWYISRDKNDTENLYFGEKYWSLITFQFNIRKMNPFELVKKVPF